MVDGSQTHREGAAQHARESWRYLTHGQERGRGHGARPVREAAEPSADSSKDAAAKELAGSLTASAFDSWSAPRGVALTSDDHGSMGTALPPAMRVQYNGCAHSIAWAVRR